jgi:hypothetical protein
LILLLIHQEVVVVVVVGVVGVDQVQILAQHLVQPLLDRRVVEIAVDVGKVEVEMVEVLAVVEVLAEINFFYKKLN